MFCMRRAQHYLHTSDSMKALHASLRCANVTDRRRSDSCSSIDSAPLRLRRCTEGRRALRIAASTTDAPTQSEQIVFEPFREVTGELTAVSEAPPSESYARLGYHPECEAAVNEQINVEYTISYVYHALYAFFDRDSVGLPGFAKYFKDASVEERDHAQLLMDFQNKRGGRVKLQALTAPESEYNSLEKGDALYAMELTLSLERLNFHKLRALHDIADKHEDAEMADFIEGQLLEEQAQAVKDAADAVAQLRRVGKGLGVFQYDRELLDGGAAA